MSFATHCLGLLAGVSPDDLLANRPAIGSGSHPERWILLGALGLVAAILFVWAMFIRKPKPTEYRGRVLVEKPSRPSSDDPDRRRRRKRRPDHPDNLPRNPTLSETGGLPPLRDEPPSSPPSTPNG